MNASKNTDGGGVKAIWTKSKKKEIFSRDGSPKQGERTAKGQQKNEEIEELGVITKAKNIDVGRCTDEKLEELGVLTKARDCWTKVRFRTFCVKPL